MFDVYSNTHISYSPDVYWIYRCATTHILDTDLHPSSHPQTTGKHKFDWFAYTYLSCPNIHVWEREIEIERERDWERDWERLRERERDWERERLREEGGEKVE